MTFIIWYSKNDRVPHFMIISSSVSPGNLIFAFESEIRKISLLILLKISCKPAKFQKHQVPPYCLPPGFSCLRWRSGILSQDSRVPYGPFGAWGVGLHFSRLCLTLGYLHKSLLLEFCFYKKLIHF